MKRMRPLGLSLFVALLLSTLASASASATTQCEAEKKAGSGIYSLCEEGKLIGSPTQSAVPFTSSLKSGTTAVVEFPPSWGGVSVVCTAASGRGEFDTASGKLEKNVSLRMASDTIRLWGCSLKGGEVLMRKCKVETERTLVPVLGTWGPGVENVSMLPGEVNEDLGEFVFVNNGGESCPIGLLGTHEFHGGYKCKSHESEAEKVEHELTCTGKLWLYREEGDTVTIAFTQMVTLAEARKGKKFSVIEAR